MTISKETWKAIEEEMAQSFVSVKFLYKGCELSVHRASISESKTALVVYVDGVIDWSLALNNKRPELYNEVWRTRTKGVYKPAKVKLTEKQFGKRRAKEFFPDLHRVVQYLDPFFPKASVLCRQFKKLEGIELIESLGSLEKLGTDE